MKNLLLTVILLCFCLPFVKAADQKMILISTNETDLILQVAPNGRLYQTYLGNKLVNESEFENLSWNIWIREGSVSEDRITSFDDKERRLFFVRSLLF